MDSIFFLILIVVTQVFGEHVREGSQDIEAPSIKQVIAFDDPAVEVAWSPVHNQDVVGYTLKLWAAEKRENNSQTAMILRSPKLYENPPQFEVLTPKNTTRAIVNYIKLDTFYAIRVAAYTNREEGPLSSASGIELHSRT